jgi:hypothetical protein
MSNGLGKIWKKGKVLYRHLPGGNERSQLGWLISEPIFELGTLELDVRWSGIDAGL